MKVLTSIEAAETNEYDAAQVSEQLLYTVVCHRKDVDPQAAINAACGPSGTTNGWTFVAREDLPEGWWEGPGAYDGHDTPYPQPCSHHPETHVHSVGAA
jgi:hypothetical protein